ncbi:PD-(D/E)XK motif protein [Streptomyces purpureus]|uniref:PD-(D/E)XK motif protein n=1 Tax=Streptomyces purpureus TaxID=1951 RepID=A0A918H1R4_9ACTN|nr:PD-(D/E)XK motif protein [Streptomyces purpureus]GGT27815.1 hypothetical protein GCM10014713_21570 [Streptomyces purpureus]
MTEPRSDAVGSLVAWTDVEHYLGRRLSVPFRLRQSPRVDYVVTPDGEIALHLQLGPRERLPRSPFPMVRIEEIADQGLRMARLRTTRAQLLRDFHDLVNAIADRVITHRRTAEQAFNETVRAWSALLDRPRGQSSERRIGLMGELATLQALSATHGYAAAVDAWKGPQGEEHDFGLPDFDLEVKTTASEQRLHTIHGSGQLTPTGDRPLWFASLQLTRGGTGGRTLAECVAAVRGKIAEEAPSHLDRFDRHLESAGWDPETMDDERWQLRAAPLVLAADERLPRLDATSVPEHLRARIRDISYTIDVSGLDPSPHAPSLLVGLRLP